MPEAITRRFLLALTVVMAALLCAPGVAPGKTLDTPHFAQSEFWELQQECVRVELVREIQGRFKGANPMGIVDGAGGVGGLLVIADTPSTGGETKCSLPVYDGLGNIVALADAVTGALTAEYAYGPYGENRGIAGVGADENPFRFSTKYFDAETGLYYYGYRYFEPVTGTWLSRDPLGESGGLNLYGFVGVN